MGSLDFSADEIFEMAQQIERNGARFYRRAASMAKAAGSAPFFLKLAAMEEVHEKVFARMREELTAAERGKRTSDPENQGPGLPASLGGPPGLRCPQRSGGANHRQGGARRYPKDGHRPGKGLDRILSGDEKCGAGEIGQGQGRGDHSGRNGPHRPLEQGAANPEPSDAVERKGRWG